MCAILGLVLCALAPHAWGQQSRPSSARPPTSEPDEEEVSRRSSPLLRTPVLGTALGQTYPGLSGYPLELFGLLMAPLERREVNLLPTFAIGYEYTNNLFMNNADKQSEFITSFTPAVMLLANRPRFQLAAGFSNASELYAKGNSPNDAFARQNGAVGVFYQPTPHITLSFADTFLRDQSPNATAGGFSLNGQGSTSNNLAPAFGWQLAPQTRLDVGALYDILRFDGQGAGIESDTYSVLTNLSHGFTPRFTGLIGYNFTYLDLRSGHGDNSTTHNPTLGFSLRPTSTLTISADGGPAFTQLGDENFITPAFSAGLVQLLPFGTASLF